jgi:hypothetical protein
LQEVKNFSRRASIHYYTWQIWPKHNTRIFTHFVFNDVSSSSGESSHPHHLLCLF